MHKTLLVLCTVLLAAPLYAQDAPKKKLTLPPMFKGGLAGFHPKEHHFIESQYGDYEPLSFENTTHRIKRDSVTDKTWQLVAMGNFKKEKGLQFASLAKVKEKPGGTLLLMFEWNDPTDSTKAHGIFFHSYLSKTDLLIRTKQGPDGALDTLELSCADVNRVCGKCYFDTEKNRVVLKMVDKD